MSFQIVQIPDLPVASVLANTDKIAVETSTGTKGATMSVLETYNGTKFIKKNVNDSTTGTITAAGFTVNSSEKIKENITPLSTNAIDNVLKLIPVSYNYKADSPVKPGQYDIGLIAEQVQQHIPELVNTDSNGNLSVDYAKLSVFLLLVLRKLAVQ